MNCAEDGRTEVLLSIADRADETRTIAVEKLADRTLRGGASIAISPMQLQL
jgi:hypothetical protein